MSDNTSHIANEPMVAFASPSYTEVMATIYRMGIPATVKERVGQRLVTESRGANLTNALNRVAHLAKLKDNWDGDGASHILSEVLDNIRSVLMFSNDNDWQNWSISPDVNGTLILQSDDALCAISLGSHEFSYLSRRGGKRIGDSHIKFTENSFLNVMRSLQ